MAKALVLNTTYEPLSIITSRRAVVLVISNKADVVEAQDTLWRAERVSFQVPSVVKLRRFVRVPYHRRVPLTRTAVFARDGNRCQYCGRAAECLDHVIPRSKGGTHTWENVVACCRVCNVRKADHFLPETSLQLVKTPQVPRRHDWVFATMGFPVDPAWHPYLLANSA
ncbi:MAG TPA: HNH endonuclease [Acidimicrobiia bacterium]|nr:HNH endonuclease [Acidimicrobiia bacterium]